MDPLTDVLRVVGVRGSVAATVLAAEPWGLDLPRVPGAAFHAVTAGTAWLLVAGRPAQRLQPGDAALLPGGRPHVLASDPEVPAEPFDHAAAQAALSTGAPLAVGAGIPRTRVLCASYESGRDSGFDPFRLLPDVVHLPAASAGDGLRATLALLAVEIADPGAGTRAVLDHVVSVLLVQVLRAGLRSPGDGASAPSWLAGLADPVTAAALAAVHAEPARAWDTALLARQAGVSTATLQRRFARQVGTSPAGYLAGWRLELAAHRLRTGDDPVRQIALDVGYTSEYAFSRAFSRRHGRPPGRYRAEIPALS